MGFTTIFSIVTEEADFDIRANGKGLDLVVMEPHEGTVTLHFDKGTPLAHLIHALSTSPLVHEFVKGITIYSVLPEDCEHQQHDGNPVDGQQCVDCGSMLDVFGNAIPTEGL